MLIWNGWGFLVAVVVFGCSFLTEISVETVMKDDRYYQTHGWPLFVAFLVAATIVWPLGRALNRSRSVGAPGGPHTGGRVVLEPGGGHTFFFIPVEYWAPLLAVIAIGFLVTK